MQNRVGLVGTNAQKLFPPGHVFLKMSDLNHIKFLSNPIQMPGYEAAYRDALPCFLRLKNV